jgi:hypothetical protein
MLGKVLAYPFGLAARRPGEVGLIVVVSVLALWVLDVAFAEIGFDALSDNELGSDEGRFYLLISSFVSAFVAALPMSLALEELGHRAGRPSLADGVALLALGIWFGVAVILPFAIGGLLTSGGLSVIAPERYRLPISVAVGAVWAIGLLFVWMRLLLAGPHTLTDNRVRLFRSWGLTKGSFWRILAFTLAALAIGFLLALLPVLPSYVWPVQSTIGSGQDALGLDTLPHLIALDLGFVVSTAYFSAAQAALFDQIVAHQDSSRPS